MSEFFRNNKAYVTMALAVVNLAVFLVLEVLGSTEDVQFMFAHGALFGESVLADGEYYRLFTSMFLHYGAAHLMNNLLMLYVIGDRLEAVTGHVRLLIIYLLGGVFANVFTVWIYEVLGITAVSAGASGAIFALMGGMLGCMARARSGLVGIGWQRMLLLVGLSVYSGFSSPETNNAAHLSGLAFGFLLGLLLYSRRRTAER